MNNINLIVLEAGIFLIVIPIIYKLFDLKGLYTYTITLFIISTISSLKLITINDFDINLGITSFTTIIIISNIIVQKKGPKSIKSLILIMLLSILVSYSILYLTFLEQSNTVKLFTNESYNNIFSGSERILFANFVTLLYTSILNYKLYYYLKKIKNKIIVSNLFSSIIILFISSIIFLVIAYAFVKEPVDIVKMIIIRYMISIIVSMVGTIPIYITNRINNK